MRTVFTVMTRRELCCFLCDPASLSLGKVYCSSLLTPLLPIGLRPRGGALASSRFSILGKSVELWQYNG